MRAVLTPPRLLSLTTPVVSSTRVDVFGGLAVGLDSGAADHDVTLAKLLAVWNMKPLEGMYDTIVEFAGVQ